MGKIFNQNEHKKLRQILRNNMPNAEKLLWARIRNNQLGAKFRRQYGIGPYIADFYCVQWKMVIELDGDSHFQGNAQENDFARDQYMQSLGLTVLRFLNSEVEQNLDGVLEQIIDELEKL